jgi:hypothetical protein
MELHWITKKNHLLCLVRIYPYYFFAFEPATNAWGYGFLDYTWDDHSCLFPTLGHAKAGLASFTLEGLL